MRKDDLLASALALLVVVILIVAGGWYEVTRYRECRAHGFSALYCFPGR